MNEASESPTDMSDREMSEEKILEIIMQWQFAWMNVMGTNEEDRKNYFDRAFPIDANMRYDLARRLLTLRNPPQVACDEEIELEKQITNYLDLNDFMSALRASGREGMIYTNDVIIGWIKDTYAVAFGAGRRVTLTTEPVSAEPAKTNEFYLEEQIRNLKAAHIQTLERLEREVGEAYHRGLNDQQDRIAELERENARLANDFNFEHDLRKKLRDQLGDLISERDATRKDRDLIAECNVRLNQEIESLRAEVESYSRAIIETRNTASDRITELRAKLDEATGLIERELNAKRAEKMLRPDAWTKAEQQWFDEAMEALAKLRGEGKAEG